MKCDCCKIKVNMIYMHKCKYCEILTCLKCITPEKHSCVNIEECKLKEKEQLQNKLMSELIVPSKLIKV
jgi:predicted nucleic acid binding AN1-type Zn finger protein